MNNVDQIDKQDFLIEIGCAELPSSALQKLALSLESGIIQALKAVHLHFDHTQLFATPRRLAVIVNALDTKQSSQKTERQGPSYQSAFDKSGTPTLACLGFAKSCGVSTEELKVKETDKGKRVYCLVEQPGQTTEALLPEIIEKTIKKLPIPKPMRWGNHETRFIRPVEWLVMLLGKNVIHTEILGKKAARETMGHRFHCPRKLIINQVKDYAKILEKEAYVMADFNIRKDNIREQLNKTAKPHSVLIDENLLDEVTSLVEWPVALKGSFNPSFLSIPKEVLITSMKTHQKCFPVIDTNGKLQPHFILVSNIESKDQQTVIHGNERVINARLSDADFFYKNDLSKPLRQNIELLKHVIFQKELGNLADKTSRLIKLTNFIGKKLKIDTALTKQAANLSKCDLVTEMVVEFPSLQGTMGYYYALNDKEENECATAIQEQYFPRFANDHLPKTMTGCALALADRLDSLIGILGINKTPTGDKDPFALRRAAQGILRILIEKALPLDLKTLLAESHNTYQVNLPNKKVIEQAYDFVMTRLKAWYSDQNISPEVFEAVAACHPTEPLDFNQRIQAVCQFQQLPEAQALAIANKRVSNILKKQEKEAAISEKIDATLFEKPEEEALADQMQSLCKSVNILCKESNYSEALTKLANLKEPVDHFFDEVMIMVEDKKLRDNRLALLKSLRQLFTQIADISVL